MIASSLLERVAGCVGYRWSDQSRLLVERALEKVAAARAISLEAAAAEVIARSPQAWRAFSDAVAIHETYFFRHPEHFALVEKLARERAAGGRPIANAWSVGCSSGEELWSLAMTLWPYAPSLRVAGSDLSPEALTFAQHGRYPARSFRDGDPRHHPALLRSADGFEISPRLRERAVFGPLNLAADPVRPPVGMAGELDVIFCRNVLVYLRPEVCAKVVAALADALADGGVLVLGAVEVPGEPPAALEPIDPALPGAFRRASKRRAPPPAREKTRAKTLHPEATPARASLDPTVARALGAARQLADEGRLDEALSAAEALEDVPAALYLAASIHLERGDAARATAALQQMLRARPDSVPAHLQLALMAHRRGDVLAVQRHRSNLQRLLEAYRDDDELGIEGMKAAWARQVLSALGGAEVER